MANNKKQIFDLLKQEEYNQVIDLINNGIKADLRYNNGKTPLMYAICQEKSDNNLRFIKNILEIKQDIDCKDNKDKTSLIYAIETGRITIVKLLIEHGANVDAKDNEGILPLYISCLKKFKKITKLLIEHGANVDAKDSFGNTALHIAYVNTDKETYDLLIEHGADVNIKNKNGKIPSDYLTIEQT